MVNDTDVTEFIYNPMNQLTGITHPDSSTETLTYDDNGNLTQSLNNTTGEVTTYAWDCFNRMTGISNSGNGATTGETVGFTYDGEHKLTQIADSDQTVDLRQTGIDTITRIARIRQSNSTEKTIVSHNIIGNGQILSKYGETGTKSQICLHYDHNSNLAIITDAHGRIVEKSLMDAYGNILPHETAIPGIPAGSPQNQPAKTLQQTLLTGSAGVIYLHKARIYNMRRRFYNSLTARFVSNDVIAGMNRYWYANANPVRYSDANGLFTIAFEKDKGPFQDYTGSQETLTTVKQAIKNVKKALESETCQKAYKCMCENGPKINLDKLFETAYIGFMGTHRAHGGRLYFKNVDPLGFWAFTGVDLDNKKREIMLGFLGLMVDLEAMTEIILHELAHHYICGIKGEPGGGQPRHKCCDVIAIECGYSVLGMRGDLYVEKAQAAIRSYMNNLSPLNETVNTLNIALNEKRYFLQNPSFWDSLKGPTIHDTDFQKIWKVDYEAAKRECKKN